MHKEVQSEQIHLFIAWVEQCHKQAVAIAMVLLPANRGASVTWLVTSPATPDAQVLIP